VARRSACRPRRQHASRRAAHGLTDDFLRAAQRDGTARPGVRARDFFLSTLFLAWTDRAPLGEDALPTLRELLETGYSTR
jgi:hypothetical protein